MSQTTLKSSDDSILSIAKKNPELAFRWFVACCYARNFSLGEVLGQEAELELKEYVEGTFNELSEDMQQFVTIEDIQADLETLSKEEYPKRGIIIATNFVSRTA